MTRRNGIVLFVVLLAAPIVYLLFPRAAQPAGPLPAATPQSRATAQCANAFGFDLFARLRATPGNRCFSPYSVHAALSMTHAGAAGKTAEQLATALHLTADARAGQRDLHGRLQAPGNHGFELSVANRLWLDRRATVLPAYSATLANDFLADSQSVDFASPSAIAAINDWTSKHTHNRIPTSLVPSDLPDPTVFVLTNALYFRGNWDKPFQKSDTQEGDFFTAPGQFVRTKLMSQKKEHRFAQFDAGGVRAGGFYHERLWSSDTPPFRALLLEYTGGDLEALLQGEGRGRGLRGYREYPGGDLAMLLLLPELGQLDALEATLNNQVLDTVVDHLDATQVPVVLPRFTVTDSFSLAKPLQDMGITDAFDPKLANFSAMTKDPIFLSFVIHKTFLEVTEEGTEAAAVTHVGGGFGGAMVAPEFIANHPFLFLIRDQQTGAILFLGRFAKP
jgi:serpin B